MSKYQELKTITDARLKTVGNLIKAKDWMIAAYMMGYALECALKATTCKTLHLSKYPSKTKNQTIEAFFRTHSFDILLVVSGMTDVFGSGGNLFGDWSAFTQEFLGNWTEMRYNTGNDWDDMKVKRVYKNLTALIAEIKKRW